MGNHVAKREPQPAMTGQSSPQAGPSPSLTEAEPTDDNEVFGHVQADVNQNNGSSSESTAVTDSKGAEGQKNAWNDASTADPTAGRPHLVRLFSRDAPGREDNTFKDRPSESDELQTIQENGGTGSECSDCTEQEAD